MSARLTTRRVGDLCFTTSTDNMDGYGWRIGYGGSSFLIAEGSDYSRPIGYALFERLIIDDNFKRDMGMLDPNYIAAQNLLTERLPKRMTK